MLQWAITSCGCSSIGRASAFQAECRGFEPLHPLFINNDETGKDCFVHVNSLNGVEIKEGDKVEFEEEEGQRGVQATNVKLA